jgi:hypothetical protein
MFTRAFHWSLSWARCIQSTLSQPISARYILISSHLYLGHLSGLFPLGFLTKILYTFLILPMCAAYPTHLVDLDLITLKTFGKEYQLMKLLIIQSFPVSCYFLPLTLNNLLSTLSSNILSICSSISVRDLGNGIWIHTFWSENLNGETICKTYIQMERWYQNGS